MARVTTTVEYVDVDWDYGIVDGVEVTCDKCGHSEESGGTDEPSLKRCAARLRENCPLNEDNHYVVET